jgi:hypothetical protein
MTAAFFGHICNAFVFRNSPVEITRPGKRVAE